MTDWYDLTLRVDQGVFRRTLGIRAAPVFLSVKAADLKASGLPVTILRNGWYTENYTGSAPGAVARGALLGTAGGGRLSSATAPITPRRQAAALTGDGHEGKTSRLAGRDIPYKGLPEADYAAALKGFGLPDGLAQAVASWDVGAAKGALFDDGHQLSRLIGRKT
jgi:NAD(P)H dehydrogenase (quinone)